MLTVAILGASGFIGGRVVERFHLGNLAEVRPIVRRTFSAARLSRFQLNCRVADAFDREALASAFSGCDVVVHAIAGDPSVILGTLAPAYEAAAKAGVRRLVYLSTATVHGQAPSPGTDENSPLDDHQPIAYNNARVKAERALLALREKGDVELVMLRPGIVVGPRSFWVTSFADSLLKGEAYLVDRGRGICNSVYVDNLVDAIHLAATASGVDREAFLLGDGEQVTWADLYRPIATALGRELEQLPEATVPTIRRTLRRRLREARESAPARAISSLVPKRLKRAAWAAWEKPEVTGTAPSPWELPEPPTPVVTLEMGLLYRCQYKFPIEKAARLLGYKPLVSFEAACQRTVRWLEFAGYPVKESSSRV